MGTMLTAADIAEMQAFNDANLPDTVALRHGTRTRQPGGTYGPIVWDGGDPVWTKPCRVSPANAPQEQLTAGSLQNTADFVVITREDVTVPVNSATDFYRLEWTHGITGLTSPLMLYVKGEFHRSYRMLSKFLATTVAPA